MKRILVIAGSDSSGGAGLEADQKVIAVHGCYAMTATTALTAQNTVGVHGIHQIPSDFVEQQIEACVGDVGVDVVKTGMLAMASTISVVANAVRQYKLGVNVVDPVMVATTGAQLLPDTAVKTMCTELLPETYLLTPNIPEANLILQESGGEAIDVRGAEDLENLARAIQKLGPKYVLVKGGHTPFLANGRGAGSAGGGKMVIANVLVGTDVREVIEYPYSESKNTHGTGCSLASAIACNLANGQRIGTAVRNACRYVDAGIRMAVDLGQGSGPINHFHSLQVMPFAPGHFIDYILEREDVKQAWHDYTYHEFVHQMGDGTLPVESFKHYMVQDYLYLIQFSRAHALAGYKSKSLDVIAREAEIVLHIRKEVALHIGECKAFGLTEKMMAEQEEDQACTAYSRYVLDIGMAEDWFALQMSLLPCLLGYHMIGQRLHGLQSSAPTKEPNRYLTWINNYVADDYTSAVTMGRALVEDHAAQQSPQRIEELVKIFVHATKMETGFWQMGLNAGRN